MKHTALAIAILLAPLSGGAMAAQAQMKSPPSPQVEKPECIEALKQCETERNANNLDSCDSTCKKALEVCSPNRATKSQIGEGAKNSFNKAQTYSLDCRQKKLKATSKNK